MPKTNVETHSISGLRTKRVKWLTRLRSVRAQRLGREFVWIGLGQVVAVFGAVVGVRLLTELLEPATYGQLALGMTVAMLVNQVLFGPLSKGASRFLAPANEIDELEGYLSALKSLVLWASVVMVMAGAVLCLGLLLLGRSQWITLAMTAMLFALLSGCNSVLNGIQNAARQRVVVALHQGLASWGRFLVAAAMVLCLGATSKAAMLGYSAALLLVLLSQGWFFRRFIITPRNASLGRASKTSPQWKARMCSYTWPFSAWGVFTWAQMASDRWALQFFATPQDVGLYAVLYQIGYYPIALVTNSIVQLMAPLLFQRAGDSSSVKRMLRVYRINRWLGCIALGLTGLAFAGSMLFRDFVFRTVVAPEYNAAAWLLPWVVLAGGLLASGQVIALGPLCATESKSLLLPKLVTALMGVVLNCIGAALFGMPGVVGACVIFGVGYLVWVSAIAVVKRRQLSAANVEQGIVSKGSCVQSR